MMKKLFYVLIAAAAAISCTSPAQKVESASAGLRFRPDGTFKILQITDTHLGRGDSPENFSWVLGRIGSAIDAEEPDLILLTGDIVTSCGTYDVWQKILDTLESRSIPYAVTWGNHDREEQLPDYELPRCFVGRPHNINTVTPEGWLEDMSIEIGPASGEGTAAVVYLMDSGDYSPVATYWDYGWITHDQIHWYVEKSRAYARANGNVPVPSYAFFHIPVTEFHEAYDARLIDGHWGEPECPGELNSGILSAFEENGDVHSIFVGHDHDNDYVAQTGGVALVYGRCCFRKEEGRIPPTGARVMEITEGDYGFRTWVREEGGVADSVAFDVPIDFRQRPAASVSGLKPGLTRTMYSQVGDILDMENTAVRGETSIVPTPRMIDRMGEGDYGAVQQGYLYVPQSGAISLHLSANDEGYVFIDDLCFRDTDYNRGQLKMNLEKGYHPIKILMKTRGGGGCWTKLMWRDQYSARYHEIPAEYFFTDPITI